MKTCSVFLSLALAVTLLATAAAEEPRARALIIGLNEVDADHYGSTLSLRGCHNDAFGIEGIVRQIGGYEQVDVLIDKQATVAKVTSLIREAAATLPAGSLFFFSIAGHGSQLEDLNQDERINNNYDNLDETWLLYDRMWIDDERGLLWKEFAPGVRIVVVADTCHAGTSHRNLAGGALINDCGFGSSIFKELLQRAPTSDLQILDFSRMLSNDEAFLGELRSTRSRSELTGEDEGRTASARGFDYKIGTATRTIANLSRAVRSIDRRDAAAIYGRNRAVYDPVLTDPQLAQGDRTPIQASLILLAACQDFQTADDGASNGAFTGALLSQWHRGFQGTYQSFLDEIKAQMFTQYNQIPNYVYYGARDDDFELKARTPFQP
ncbi:MAG: caspase family protein [Pirellulales bacterium]|nr:caspase family protein [Pirellulales bacterium]